MSEGNGEQENGRGDRSQEPVRQRQRVGYEQYPQPRLVSFASMDQRHPSDGTLAAVFVGAESGHRRIRPAPRHSP
jgi:hypothetical protein